MKSHSERIHCSTPSDPVPRGRCRCLRLIAVFFVALAGCEVSVPFNVLLLPFLPDVSIRYAPDSQDTQVLPSEVEAPAFSLKQVSLNDVQIPFDVTPASGTGGITSASVELGLTCGFSPFQESVSVEVETTLTLYIAPTTASNRFASEYRVPLDSLEFGWSNVADLSGELSPEQLANLESGGLMLGLEFSDTRVSVANDGATDYEILGIDVELTNLRIRGTVESASIGLPGVVRSQK